MRSDTDCLNLAFALVRHPRLMEQKWMLHRTHCGGPFGLLMAERLEGESFRQSLDREIAWSLELRQGKDYLISQMARLNVEDDFVLPGSDMARSCRFAFLVVDFYGRQIKQEAIALPNTTWGTGPEFHAGFTREGAAILPWQVEVIRRTGVIPNYVPSGD